MAQVANFFKGFFEDDAPKISKDNHQHLWELLLRTYCPPISTNLPQGTSEDVIQKVIFGFTTLLWECTVGKETKKEEILGTEPLQLDELIAKIDQFGTQTFQKNGSTYVMGKFQGAGATVPLK